MSPDPTVPSRRGSRWKRAGVVAAAGCAVIAGVGVAMTLWLNAGDAPAEFRPTDQFGSPGETADVTGPAGSDDAPWAGVWEVEADPASDRGAGYRIVEDVPLGGPEEVVARTGAVSGRVTLDAAGLVDAELVVPVDTMASDNSLRDGVVASDYLETGSFPTASIRIVEPRALDVPRRPATVMTFDAPAQLDLHGRTESVTVRGDAQWSADRIEIVGTIDLTLDQFGITRPELFGRSARNDAVIEFKLHFVPA